MKGEIIDTKNCSKKKSLVEKELGFILEKIKKKLYNLKNSRQKRNESKDVLNLIKSKETIFTLDIFKSSISDFCIATFNLASKELNCEYLTKNIKNYNKFVMVGCGAISETLICFSFKYPLIKCVGLDIDEVVLKNANKVKEKFKFDSIIYLLEDANKFDFTNNNERSIIFIATLVKPKFEILKKIVNTTKKGTLIIVRSPLNFDKIMLESANYNSIPNLLLVDEKNFVEENVQTSFLLVK